MNKDGWKIKPGSLVIMFLVIIVVPFLPLLISWRWDWWEAWVYALLSIFGFIISRLLAAKKYPDLIKERAKTLDHADTKGFDKILAPIAGLGGALLMLAAGLDGLFRWTPAFSLVVKIVALVFILAGYAWSSYALIENRFFSSVVRIQTERGHEVVSSGPYGVMRHPGYAGALLLYLATPFFLDSWWTLVPAVFLVVVLVIRTGLEDRTLQEELPGYREYAGRVRYRLLPGVW
jgi:protein-S-isoprenylcysteine O-methyltransferase Ste14